MQVIKPLSISIAGAGRMGRAIVTAIDTADDLELAGLWVRDEAAFEGIDGLSNTRVSADIDRVVAAADVLVDFSLPEATGAILDAAVRHRIPIVCGVSGLGQELQQKLAEAAIDVAIVYDRNMSLGVAVLENLVARAAASLGRDFEIEVHETHHMHKVDAPSGTALKLGEAAAAARNQDFDAVRWYAPSAATEKPAAGDIRFEVERRGEVPGDHSVILSSSTERLTLGHSVTARQVFADGAVRAARWILGRPPGRYRMQDVLFGESNSKKTVR